MLLCMESISHPLSPTGEQFEIERGELRAVVAGVGATLRLFEAGGKPVIQGFGEGEMSPASHGQILLPWPNRVAGGHYSFAGEEHQLPVNEPDRNAALHGLVRWSGWRLVSRTLSEVSLGLRLHPQEGYPFLLDLEARYALSEEDGLTVRITATNPGPGPAPCGIGNHPYLTPGPGKVDDLRLHLPARSYYETDENLIPRRRTSVDGTPYDFREPRTIGGTRLDTCFTDLRPDADGRVRIRLEEPGRSRAVELWMEESCRYVQLFTSDTLPGEDFRSALAVEPMTCAPDAFNSGDGLAILEPGCSLTSAWGIKPQL